MPAKKEAPSSVKHVVDSEGGHHIGVDVDGVFVSIASAAKDVVQDRVAAAKSPEYANHPLADSGDPAEPSEEEPS